MYVCVRFYLLSQASADAPGQYQGVKRFVELVKKKSHIQWVICKVVNKKNVGLWNCKKKVISSGYKL